MSCNFPRTFAVMQADLLLWLPRFKHTYFVSIEKCMAHRFLPASIDGNSSHFIFYFLFVFFFYILQFCWRSNRIVFITKFSLMQLHFAGLVFLNQPGAEQQAALRVFLTHHSLRPLPGEGHGWDCQEHGLDLCFDYLRGEQLWHQGKYGVAMNMKATRIYAIFAAIKHMIP